MAFQKLQRSSRGWDMCLIKDMTSLPLPWKTSEVESYYLAPYNVFQLVQSVMTSTNSSTNFVYAMDPSYAMNKNIAYAMDSSYAMNN